MRKGNLLSPQDRAIYEHPEKQVAPVIFVYGGTRVSSGGFCSGESFVLERYSVVQRTGRTGGSNDDFDSDTESQANEINNNPKSPAGSRPGSPSPDGAGSSPGLASPCSPGRASTRNLAFADSSENGPPGSPGSKSRGGAGRTRSRPGLPQGRSSSLHAAASSAARLSRRHQASREHSAGLRPADTRGIAAHHCPPTRQWRLEPV